MAAHRVLAPQLSLLRIRSAAVIESRARLLRVCRAPAAAGSNAAVLVDYCARFWAFEETKGREIAAESGMVRFAAAMALGAALAVPLVVLFLMGTVLPQRRT